VPTTDGRRHDPGPAPPAGLRPGGSVLRDGVTAGLLGAGIVALWFLVLDTARGRPLFTPALLGAAVFRGVTTPADLGDTAGVLLGYTALHALAFVAFGIVAASLLVASEHEPPAFLAFIVLFAAFEVFFFAVLAAFGRSLLGALLWWAIFGGNLLASVGMLWFLLRSHPRLPARLLGSWSGVLREGAVAGVIGAALIMLWFLGLDSLQADPFRTPRVLGTALLGRVDATDAIVAYTFLHTAVFIGFGFVTAALIASAEQQPLFLFPLVILYAAFEMFIFAVVLVLARWVFDELAGWAVVVGNLLSASGMLAYYFGTHRPLVRRVREALADEGPSR
jgi:hypothetical protein